MVLLLHAI
jgi:hypothetical protein